MSNEKFESLVEELTYAVENKKSFDDLREKYGHTKTYYNNLAFSQIRIAYAKGTITKDRYEKVLRLYAAMGNLTAIGYFQAKQLEMFPEEHVVVVVDNDDQFANTCVGEEVRDTKGNITHYEYKILKRNKPALEGKLTREEMRLILEAYTKDGQNLTKTTVSQMFPNFTSADMGRILRAFNITKDTFPVAQHDYEEKTEDTILEQVYEASHSEAVYKRKYEQGKVNKLDRDLQAAALANAELKEEIAELKEENLTLQIGNQMATIEPIRYEGKASKNTLIIWLSDMHIGCDRSKDQELGEYNAEEIMRRIGEIVCRVHDMSASFGGFEEIIVCNLGDAIDGMDGKTTRRDHSLPQNMTNGEMADVFVEAVTTLISSIGSCADSISYYAVGSSNHGGDFEVEVNKRLAAVLQGSGLVEGATVFKGFLGSIEVNNQIFVMCHGKDESDMKSPWPATISRSSDIPEALMSYLKNHNLLNTEYDDRVTVVKGDSHRSAATGILGFEYKSVGAFIGSTVWSKKSYGDLSPICEYSVVSATGCRMDGKIKL